MIVQPDGSGGDFIISERLYQALYMIGTLV